MQRLLITFAIVSMASASLGYAATVTFDSAADYTTNFRQLANGPLFSQSSADGGVLSFGTSTIDAASVIVFDNPSLQNTFLNEPLSMDIKGLSAAFPTTGFYARINSTETDGYFAIAGINSGNDNLRIFRGDNPTTGASTNRVLLASLAGTNFANIGQYYTLRFNLANIGNDVAMTLDLLPQGGGAPLATLSHTDTNSPLLAAGKVGIRAFGTANSPDAVRMDNFRVVPEPTSTGLLFTGVVLVAFNRKRKREQRTG